MHGIESTLYREIAKELPPRSPEIAQMSDAHKDGGTGEAAGVLRLLRRPGSRAEIQNGLGFQEKRIEMDYLLTFEDGSEGLMHHGIKGMKWGVWNAETRRRHLGSTERQQAKYAKKTVKELKRQRKSGYFSGENVPLVNEVHERLGEARKKLMASDPLGQKYYSDPKLQKKYKEQYADQLAKQYDNTPEGRKMYREAVLYDDLDQGSLSAFSFESSYDLYVKDNVKDVNKYFSKQHDAIEEYRNAVKSEVDKVLGPYSKTVYDKGNDWMPTQTLRDEIADQSYSRARDEISSKRKYF